MFSVQDAAPNVKEIFSGLQIFDLYRFVDPQTNLVYNFIEGKLVPNDEFCYSVWHRNAPCQNCTSRRAFCENKQIIKLEYLDGKINLIVSVPLTLSGRKMVLELAKDVTASLVVNDDSHPDNTNVMNILKEFNELAVLDSYTRLYNKGYVEQELAKLIRSCRAEGKSFSAALMDIDFFKKINDTYGHQAGDVVLKTIAKYISEAVAEDGCWAGRIGGDEFMLVFQNIDESQVREICRVLSQRISAHVYEKDGVPFHAGVSIGIHSYSGQKNAKEFFELVDQKMYEEKRRRKAAAGEA